MDFNHSHFSERWLNLNQAHGPVKVLVPHKCNHNCDGLQTNIIKIGLECS